MGYAKTITILSLAASVTLSMVQPTPTSAYAEDMSGREVEALLMARIRGVSKTTVHGISVRLIELCKQYNFPVSSVLSLIATESGFKADAVSNVGAIGLMQVMPSTAKEMAKKTHLRGYHGSEDLYDPKTNLSVGIAYLSDLRGRYVQSHRYLAAYNLGPSKYNRFVKNRLPRPASVTSYVNKVHNGVYRIRRSAQELVYASVTASVER